MFDTCGRCRPVLILYRQNFTFEPMKSKEALLQRIKEQVQRVNPTARVILFGSYARGDNREDSDIDLLILVNKEDLSYRDKKAITAPI